MVIRRIVTEENVFSHYFEQPQSRNDVKSACFDMFYVISAIFEDIDLKFCTHIHDTLPSNICYGFLKVLIFGETVSKRKNGHFLKIFEIFDILKIRDSSFVALLILRHFI